MEFLIASNYVLWIEFAGMATTGKGYDGFVELTRKVMQTRSPLLQRAGTMRVLHSTVPPWLLKIVNQNIFPDRRNKILMSRATLDLAPPFKLEWAERFDRIGLQGINKSIENLKFLMVG